MKTLNKSNAKITKDTEYFMLRELSSEKIENGHSISQHSKYELRISILSEFQRFYKRNAMISIILH